jgi:hypothetical protein
MTKRKKITDQEINELMGNMTNFSKARWLALSEAISIVAEKADDKKMNFDDITINHPATVKYIDSTCDIICKTLDVDDKKIEHMRDIKNGK